MMEQYNTTVGDPSLLATLTSPRSSRSMSLSLSDTSSSADGSPISSPVMSPQQHRSPFQPPPPPSMTLASLQQPPASKSHSHHYHHHHHHPSTSSYLRHGGRVEQRVLVTCGGQMVSVMEGVRNVPDDMMTYVEGSSSAASHF
ncbi:hypothetical protein AaE_000755 [Aphanomyces astaci]|nr:hypothetical protein AaE_000755 [Aphanomyces astaci]